MLSTEAMVGGLGVDEEHDEERSVSEFLENSYLLTSTTPF